MSAAIDLSVPVLTSFGQMSTNSSRMLAAFNRLRRVTDSSCTVLITGETGTGKDLAARALHDTSLRRNSPFVAINCGGINSTLIESELFGHEQGAFTGASTRRAGVFEQADGGTLFLDEIGELPLELQPRLLRVLDSGEVRRIGGAGAFHVDVRVVAATNRDLAADVAAGRFRADLLYRLRVIEVHLPPLRERMDDLELLVGELIEPGFQLSTEAWNLLRSHDWPGNVRELKNVLARAAAFTDGDEIQTADIDISVLSTGTHRTLAEVQRDHMLEVLDVCRGNRARAARQLGIARSTLHEKLSRYQTRDAAPST